MMQLYYGSGSPFSWRVQLALEEKGLPYEPVLLSFAKGEVHNAEHRLRHPHGKVPALTDGDLILYESSPIVEYLEDRYPTPPLLPPDAAARAQVRMEEAEAVEYLAGAFRPLGKQLFGTPAEQRDAAAIDAARAAVRAEIAALEGRAARRGGAWVVGATLTRADLAWLPFVELAVRGGVEIDAARLPWVVRWRDAMRARPSYARSYPPHWKR